MPVYEYICRKSGHRFERYAAITAPKEPLPTVGCPTCSGRNGIIIKADLVVSKTAPPKLKAGIGGFYKPNA